MLRKLPTKVMAIAIVMIIAAILAAGCSSGATQSTPASSGQSVQQSTQPTTQQSSGQQSGTQSGQTGQPGQSPDNSKMDAVMTRAAAILGVSADSFKKAFQNAMGGAGQPGTPPGDNMTAKGGQPPSGVQPPSQSSSGQQPPAPPSGSGTQPDMTAIYTKMATELNLTADAISKAMTQAQQEQK